MYGVFMYLHTFVKSLPMMLYRNHETEDNCLTFFAFMYVSKLMSNDNLFGRKFLDNCPEETFHVRPPKLSNLRSNKTELPQIYLLTTNKLAMKKCLSGLNCISYAAQVSIYPTKGYRIWMMLQRKIRQSRLSLMPPQDNLH